MRSASKKKPLKFDIMKGEFMIVFMALNFYNALGK